jgi:polar amino acid transport system permease protein
MDWLDNIIKTFFDFEAMWQVFPQLLGIGLVNTLVISIWATLIGIVLGMVVAIMGISPSRWLRIPARIYTDVFRGLPAILTILLIGQGFARFSQQLFGPSPYPLGILALSLIASAYIGEIFRAGILGVDRTQWQAARVLGLGWVDTLRFVILPQAARKVLPPTGSTVIYLIKGTALASAIGTPELLRVGQLVANETFRPVETLTIVAIAYFVLTYPIALAFHYIERRLAAGRA